MLPSKWWLCNSRVGAVLRSRYAVSLNYVQSTVRDGIPDCSVLGRPGERGIMSVPASHVRVCLGAPPAKRCGSGLGCCALDGNACRSK